MTISIIDRKAEPRDANADSPRRSGLGSLVRSLSMNSRPNPVGVGALIVKAAESIVVVRREPTNQNAPRPNLRSVCAARVPARGDGGFGRAAIQTGKSEGVTPQPALVDDVDLRVGGFGVGVAPAHHHARFASARGRCARRTAKHQQCPCSKISCLGLIASLRPLKRRALNHKTAGIFPAPSLCMRYARFGPLGATGFDVGCEPSGAYRGAVPSLIFLQTLVANDNYALAA